MDLKYRHNELQNKMEIAESIWFYQNQSKNIDNCFVDDDDEKFHQYIDKIGEGATSITYKIIDTRTNQFMCKKVLKVDPKNPLGIKDVKNIIKEFEILNKINHPCICTAYYINTQETVKDTNVKSNNNTIAIFLEYLEFDLKSELQKGLNDTLKTRIVVEISHALNFLHKHGMIHRDLKIENIMLNSVYQAKLVDFGLIRIHECIPEYSYVAESMTKGVGTLLYMSPEMLNEEEYDYKTDVYSFGMVLYVMFVGNLPKQSLKDKMRGKEIDLPNESNSISAFCIQLIKKCLSGDPKDRPTFEEILEDLRENEYSLTSSINKEVIHQRDMELALFEVN